MVDTQKLRGLLPHYLAMLVLIVIAMILLRLAIGEVRLLVEFGVAIAIALIYPFAVRHFGFEPGAWE